MRPLFIIGYFCLGIGSMACVSTATLLWFDVLGPRVQAKPLVIDARRVVSIFTDQRGSALDDVAYRDALRVVDAIVSSEATRIYETTGHMIINADHILAGGQDVTNDFANQVVAIWDARQ